MHGAHMAVASSFSRSSPLGFHSLNLMRLTNFLFYYAVALYGFSFYCGSYSSLSRCISCVAFACLALA